MGSLLLLCAHARALLSDQASLTGTQKAVVPEARARADTHTHTQAKGGLSARLRFSFRFPRVAC